MDFERNKHNVVVEYFGYIIMYFIFTTVLYFLLKLLNRLPGTWGYIQIMIITIFIVLVGKLIKLWLK